MTDYTRLIDAIRVRVPGALDDAIELELETVLRDFLGSTNSWVEEVEFTTQDGVTEYEVLTSEGIANRLLAVVDEANLTVPAGFKLPDSVVLARESSPGRTLTAYIGLIPIEQNPIQGVPSWMFNKHRNTLIHGVLGNLFSQPAKTYSNERLAIFHMRTYRNLLAQHREEVLRQYSFRAQAWNFPRNFA
jgi:hypothetical protein